MLLEVRNIRVDYGSSNAVSDLSLSIEEGELVTVIGANGAGKSTVMRAISGLQRLTSGEIWFQGIRIDGVPVHKIAKMGIVHIPEDRMIVGQMTVLDNLKMGGHLRGDRSLFRSDLEKVYDLFPDLKEKQSQLAANLSGGQQQMLAIGRGLMGGPRLLLIDEPSVGLSPILVVRIAKVIRDVSAAGVSILLVEQNARLALKLASKAYVLEMGRVVMQGACSELAKSEHLKRCYLGAGDRRAGRGADATSYRQADEPVSR